MQTRITEPPKRISGNDTCATKFFIDYDVRFRRWGGDDWRFLNMWLWLWRYQSWTSSTSAQSTIAVRILIQESGRPVHVKHHGPCHSSASQDILRIQHETFWVLWNWLDIKPRRFCWTFLDIYIVCKRTKKIWKMLFQDRIKLFLDHRD